MVIFAAISMIIVVVAGIILLASTDWAQQDASDREFYSFLAIIGFGAPLIWTLLNLFLLSRRHQTGGQYVAGIRLAREDQAPLSSRNIVAWWFCFNPLLFSWPMAIMAGLPLAAVIAVVLGTWTIVAFGTVVTLCLLMPVAAFVYALLDDRNRAPHDRVVGTVVVPA
jgi:uncharacterized RDD family membrane protein YckC